MHLFGSGDRHLKMLRDAFAVQLTGRGCNVKLLGERGAVDRVAALLEDMISRLRSGAGIPRDHVEKAVEKYREERGLHAAGEGGGEGGSGDEVEGREADEGGGEPGEVAPGGGGLHDAEDAEGQPYGPGHLPPCSPAERALVRKIARSGGQASYLQSILENEMVFCIGPAGTGKTFLAVHMAIHLLREDRVRRIVLCRPAVEAGEKLGFLPGDFQAKINPYLRPLYDALNDLLDYDQVRRYMEREVIEILPLAYMRGRTLNNAFIILDEGQNTSISQMKMFLTRMGMNSRIVVNGDVTQVDLAEGQPSGLLHVRPIVQDIPGIAWVELQKSDIVRHPLVRRIVAAYEDAEKPPTRGSRRT
jgi:phosphate starvation-inducible protein PhoH